MPGTGIEAHGVSKLTQQRAHDWNGTLAAARPISDGPELLGFGGTALGQGQLGSRTHLVSQREARKETAQQAERVR